MDLALIEKLMRMLEQSDLQELDVNEGGTRIKLAKKRSGVILVDDEPAKEPVVAASAPVVEASRPHQIIAGMAGTFYRSPSPGAAPFVEEGTVVEDGQQLAIVEAMKMLNPVESDVAGTILRVLLKDGDSVSPGMALFEVSTR